MRKLFFTAIAMLITLSISAQNKEEKDAIIKVIDAAYVQGIHNATDIDNINKGFHPGFNLLGIGQDGKELTQYPIKTWEASVRKRVEDGQLPAVKTTAKYPMINITGQAAVAKVELFRGGRQIYTDYLFLYKFEEGWRIVSKVYNTTPKETKD
jgi:hypothetical protein